jgi:hypothetical protein
MAFSLIDPLLRGYEAFYLGVAFVCKTALNIELDELFEVSAIGPPDDDVRDPTAALRKLSCRSIDLMFLVVFVHFARTQGETAGEAQR